MRILHTADWHLNERLSRVDRQPDIVARLHEIARYLDKREVDVLLVAGDVFSTFSRSDALRDALRDIDEIFRSFLLRGGTIVALSGNHDHEATFTMLHAALDLANPIDRSSNGPRPMGRLYLTVRATRLLLKPPGGQPVQFVLLPYPTPPRYLGEFGTRYASLEERNRVLQQALTAQLGRIRQGLEPTLPSVLCAHLHVRGAEVHSLYHITEANDVVFETGDLPTSWAYVALGHIHKPQALPGMPHVRYAGSIERFDYGERHDRKGCVLVEIGPSGLTREPEILPLDATPIYDVVITDPEAQLPELVDAYPDRERALVRYEIYWKPGEHLLGDITRKIETIFPRWYERVPKVTGVDDNEGTHALYGTLRDVRGTARDWLENELRGDSDRDELLALATTYLDRLEAAE
jgi:exonuclease SbcD